MDQETGRRFLSPPERRNAAGDERRVGFEFEFTGPDIDTCAERVRSVFGGEHAALSTFVHRVTGTEFGDFTIEIDSTIVKDKTYEEHLRTLGIDPSQRDMTSIEESIAKLFSWLVPYEISTPPIPLSGLELMDVLREELRMAGAKGTKASMRYAFGLHINAEVPTEDHLLYQNVLRSFVLLYPWIEKQVDVDLTRKLAPYIKPFCEDYNRLILSDRYPTTEVQFIEDYLAYNATRNRPLDMLPLISGLNYAQARGAVHEPHLLKSRPAYHYRMPNCLIDDPSWTIQKEWNTWVAVERLAAEPAKLEEMARAYCLAEESSSAGSSQRWPALLDNYLS